MIIAIVSNHPEAKSSFRKIGMKKCYVFAVDGLSLAVVILFSSPITSITSCNGFCPGFGQS